MATKQIVPHGEPTTRAEYEFKDGKRQLASFERMYLDNGLVVEITGKSLKELTYQEWLEQVFSFMQVRNQFVGEVTRLRTAHFTNRY